MLTNSSIRALAPFWISATNSFSIKFPFFSPYPPLVIQHGPVYICGRVHAYVFPQIWIKIGGFAGAQTSATPDPPKIISFHPLALLCSASASSLGVAVVVSLQSLAKPLPDPPLHRAATPLFYLSSVRLTGTIRLRGCSPWGHHTRQVFGKMPC